jgi:hypothetical protein
VARTEVPAQPNGPGDGEGRRPGRLVTALGIFVGAGVYGVLMALRSDAAGRWTRIGFAAAAGTVFGIVLAWVISRSKKPPPEGP